MSDIIYTFNIHLTLISILNIVYFSLTVNERSSLKSSLEYPTDRSFMSSVEIAFEERVKQISSSEKVDGGGTTLAECSPFDQALASVLLMNGGKPLRGVVSRRLQQVCEILEMLQSSHNMSLESSGEREQFFRVQQHQVAWPRPCDRLLIQGMEENWTTKIVVQKMRELLLLRNFRGSELMKKKKTKKEEEVEEVNEVRGGSSPAEMLAMYGSEKKIMSRIAWLCWLNDEILTVLPLGNFDNRGRFVELVSSCREVCFQYRLSLNIFFFFLFFLLSVTLSDIIYTFNRPLTLISILNIVYFSLNIFRSFSIGRRGCSCSRTLK